jgi:hypothetical protein
MDAREMFKVLERELNSQFEILRDPVVRHAVGQIVYCVSRVNREADALASQRAAAPSPECAGVAGASVSRPTLEEAERWLRWFADVWDQSDCPVTTKFKQEEYASVILAELERLRHNKK